MANKLGSLVVSLGLDAAEFTKGMTKSEYEAAKSMSRIKGEFDSVMKYVAGLSLGAAFVKSVQSTADYADEMGKLAQKAGITTEEVSKLAYASRQADVDNEQLAKGLRALGEDALSGGKKLAALGISVTDASGKTKSSSALFREVADVIAGMEDPQRKAAAAAELLGEKVGPALVPLLNQGAAGLKDMADEAERFGRVVTDDAAKAAEQFNDNLTKLQERGAGFAAVIGNEVIPWVNRLIDEFGAGARAAGGFWSALGALWNIPTFEKPAEGAKKYREELDKLQKAKASSSDFASPLVMNQYDAQIAKAKTRLAYFNNLQQMQMTYAGDDQSKAEAVRLGIAPAARPASSGKAKPGKKSGGLSDRDRDYQRMLDDYAKAEDDNRVRVILKRMKEEEDAQKELISIRRQGAIEEFDALSKRNEEYQKWVQSLVDDTPTQKLEQQREAMIALAAEYERGRFGAAGSADAIAKYSEVVGTYLGTLRDGVKEINATANQAGDIFGSWLERAIADGAKLSDVVNGLIRDLALLAIRKSVIEPAAAGFSTWVGALMGSTTASFDGGGYTGSGARSGGVDGKGGFPAILHPNETVIDHTKGQGMGGVTVVQNMTIDARGADAGVEARIQAAMRQAKAEAVAEVQAKASRGGSYAASLGRA